MLDAAILALHDDVVPEIKNFLSGFSKLPVVGIDVNEEELELWKEMLPAYIERCREWSHLPTCEYKAEGIIPISFSPEKQFLCSCSNGTLPPNFITGVPNWGTGAKYMVRAAISSLFAVPFVDPVFHIPGFKWTPDAKSNICRTCGRGEAIDGKKLLKCGKCEAVKYCSVEFQKADWKGA